MRNLERQSIFLPLMGLLVLLAWISLSLWEFSPYGRYLQHGQWTQIGAIGSLHEAHGAGGGLEQALIYIGGWVLMTTAMMLPTTLPLLEAFRRLIRLRPERQVLLVLVIGGYLATWCLFGIAAHGLDGVLRSLVPLSDRLSANGWILGAIVFAVAGLFQFSSLKYRCLEKCRAPLSFVIRRWNGQNVYRQALMLGLDHGAYCVGCCWALMLLMFVLGTGSVGWMFLLGAVMAAEKNLPFGGRLAAPLGVFLLVTASLIVIYHLGPGSGQL